MSTRGRGRPPRGCGRGRMTLSEPVGSGHGSGNETPDSPAVTLRVLERVAGVGIGIRARKSVPERLKANGTEVFRGVSGVAPNTAEYWMEATERIMDDLDFTVEEKLKGVVSLLRDKAY
ncbi:ATP-dependent zinc metalloprotease FtsH [Gossypium australe]|uniref:ATP-dependent zinc metalloprotease FtsH n=1 Tax=Gossypium australe TaxID=47621 RepID=A0A5B6V9D7_9ROSI|nr:ATP-dependent zinc metalloprotease FtsH [Gossypium australe]